MNLKIDLVPVLASLVLCTTASAQALGASPSSAPGTASPESSAGNPLPALTPDQIKVLTPDGLKALTIPQIATFKTDQVQAFSAEQITDFSNEQIAAIDPKQVLNLSTDQIKGFTSTQLAVLTTAQIQALTTTQIPAISSYKITALRPGQISDLSLEQTKALTPEQIKVLLPAQIQALNPDYVKSLVAETTNTPSATYGTVPLAQAHTIFANEFTKDEQDLEYPVGLQGVLFVTPDELDNSIVSNNWARVRYGVATVVSQPIKGFLMLQAPSRLQQVYVYVANSDSQIDLTKIPYKTALTPKMSQDHYGDLYPHFDKLRHYLGPFANSFYPFLGISVNTLGDAQATRGSPTTFLVGGGVDLGPYAGQNLGISGYSQDSHVTTGLSVGFSFDLALLSKIFK